MKFPGKLLFFLLIIISCNVNAQVQVSSAPFSAATPYLEPDGRREVLKISDKHFVVLSKIKGGFNSESDYSLEKFDVDLNNIYKTPLHLGTYEDVKEIYHNGTHIIVLTVVHQMDISESKLLAYGFNSTTGVREWDKTLMQFKVAPFETNRSKGSVEETVENAIASSLNKNFIVPYEYQYDIQFSPDGSKIIAYTFDYSKSNMIANAAIFDKDLNKLNEGIIPIDNNIINYGIYVNNRGEAYVLNVDRLGRIVLVQYNLKTKENILLDIQYSSTQRESLKLSFIDDDVVFVGSVNTSDGKLVGVMYAKFNFAHKLVDKINFHRLEESFIQTISATISGHKHTVSEETWLNYELTNFYVNKYEKVVMVVEKREINSLGYHYKSEAVINPENWKERVAKVSVGGIIMFSFNSNDEMMWENYFYKSQSSDINSGMTSSSCVLDINDEMIRMVYALPDNSTGIYNTYHYVQWDASTGNKSKDMALQNDEKLSLVRNYSIWMNEKVVLVGRKGLMGKKYMMNSFSINPFE